MIINNFEQIKSLLSFESDDCFYHLQLLVRKKDLPEAVRGRNNNARCIKTYYIKNLEYLDSKKEEIIMLCEAFTARAYINLNCKSFEKASLQLIKEVVDRVIFKQFEHVYRAYESIVGESNTNIGNKRWIIDVDNKNLDTLKNYVNEICKCQSNRESRASFDYDNVIDIIPTVQGWHIITHPFNLKQIEPFRCINPFDIQKNNPTLCYFNKKEDEEKTN